MTIKDLTCLLCQEGFELQAAECWENLLSHTPQDLGNLQGKVCVLIPVTRNVSW